MSNWESLRSCYAMRRNGYSGPFFNALALMAMAVWLLMPLELFSAGTSYVVMADIASELGWGVYLGLCGSLMLKAAYQRRPREVAIGSLGASLGYFSLFVSYAAAGWRHLAVPLFFILTIRTMSIYTEFMARELDPHLQLPHGHTET